MQRRHWLLAGILGACVVAAVRADFGRAIVDEAIDLFSSQLGDGDDDPRTMEDLLHWAISHSDPEKLSAQAEEAQRIQMVRDLKEQRRRVKELLDHVRSQPTEIDMMKEGIGILRRSGASDTELLAALQALQVLVEPIDNANDLHPLGGIAAVVAQLTRGSELAAAAAHVLGTAASNNPTFQRHLLAGHPDIVETLLQVSQSAQEEAAVKGVYALAALVRNLPEARRAFVDAGGFGALGVLLRGEAVAARVKRKALSLFMDLADTLPAEAGAAAEGAKGTPGGGGGGSGSGPHIRTLHRNEEEGSGGSGSDPRVSGGDLAAAAISAGMPHAVVALLLEPDADMQEKALLVVQRLAASGVARAVLRESGADDAISRLHQQLQADAPEPGDEPDPYHEYLLGLVRQVTALMARVESGAEHDGSAAGGCASAGGCGAGAGARDRAGAGGPAGSGGAERDVAGSEEPQQQALLGGTEPIGAQRLPSFRVLITVIPYAAHSLPLIGPRLLRCGDHGHANHLRARLRAVHRRAVGLLLRHQPLATGGPPAAPATRFVGSRHGAVQDVIRGCRTEPLFDGRDELMLGPMVMGILEDARAAAGLVRQTLRAAAATTPPLVLVPSAPGFEPPVSLLPHIQLVGGLLYDPPGGLPPYLADWLNEQPDLPIVYVGFGTLVKFADEVYDAVLTALGRIPARVLWAFRPPAGGRVTSRVAVPGGAPPNVRLEAWVPQLHVLRHRAVRAAVSRGGFSSVAEAMYCGKPVVAIPAFGDNDQNAWRLQRAGAGIMLSKRSPTLEKELEAAINKVLDEPSFTAAARRLAVLTRTAPGAAHAAALVESVAALGSTAHLSQPDNTAVVLAAAAAVAAAPLALVVTVSACCIATLRRARRAAGGAKPKRE